jgi:hypothetical protein
MEYDDDNIQELYPRFTLEQQVGQPYQRNFIKCNNLKCPNQVQIPSLTSPTKIYCQQCLDKLSLKNTFKNIHFLEDYIIQKKTHIQDLQNKITNIQNEVKDLKEELFLEKIHIKYDVDVVSENKKFYQGSDETARDGEYNIELETHCTIVRVETSPENVYFGHVTLVIRYLSGLEFRWHYGTYVSYDKIPKRDDLIHKFWSKLDENKRFPPSDTKVKSFGYFEHIPVRTTLADMMTHHLDKCAEYFRRQKQKQRWHSQVWYEDDQVEVGGKTERATALVDRLEEIKGNRASNPHEKLESLRIKRQQEEAARSVLAKEAKLAKLANQAKEAKPTKKEKQTLEPEELERIKAQQAEERKQQSLRDTQEQVRNQELQERFNIEEQERSSAAKQAENAAKLAAKLAEEKAAKLAAKLAAEEKTKQDDIEIQKATKKSDEERAKLKPVQKKEVNPQNINELKAKNDTNRLLESIEKSIEKCKKMEDKINTLETENPISPSVFALRKSLYNTYGSFLEGIEDNIRDVKLNKYLKHEDKTAFLESLRKQKEYLYGVYGVLASKDIKYAVDDWYEFYNKEIVPKEEKLKTLDNPSDRDAVRIRRELIRYYRIFIANCDDYVVNKFIPTFVDKSERNIIVRKILELRNNIVNADKRVDALCEIERDFLKEFYKTQDDNLNEDDTLIAENMTILYPKKCSTLDKAKFFLDKFDPFKEARALEKLSTKTVILFSTFFEEKSPS